MGSVPGICKGGTALVLGAGLEDRAPGSMCSIRWHVSRLCIVLSVRTVHMGIQDPCTTRLNLWEGVFGLEVAAHCSGRCWASVSAISA